jgi:hypothetical protein
MSVHKNHSIPIFIILLAIGLTFVSLFFVYTQNGLQSAGFPVPVIRDHIGSSPISGWGRLGPEDISLLPCFSIPLNVMFYSAILWPLQKVISRRRLANSQS